MIKYGELSTKKANINMFLNQLKKNISFSLSDLDVSLEFDKGRMFIEGKEEDFETILSKLHTVFGIHEYVIAYKLENKDFDTFSKMILDLVKDKDFKTFKVVTKRSDKKYPMESMEISRKVGAVLLKNMDGISVDVHNPELEVNVEVRLKDVYVYFNSEEGIGGYPVGVAGKGMLMLSGGIDSPVAGYMAIKRGVRLECLYFESPPHTSVEAKNKVIELAKKLAIYNNDIKLHVIKFTDIQTEILKKCPRDYLITIMRRMMYRITERVARMNNCKIIVNGESIGQVASQTLTSMNVINEVVRIPVIRPVACFDKLEIIDIAKKIDTYETSILPFEDCCTIFLPKHPVINPKLETCIKEESKFDYETLVNECVENIEVITNLDDKKYTDIL